MDLELFLNFFLFDDRYFLSIPIIIIVILRHITYPIITHIILKNNFFLLCLWTIDLYVILHSYIIRFGYKIQVCSYPKF